MSVGNEWTMPPNQNMWLLTFKSVFKTLWQVKRLLGRLKFILYMRATESSSGLWLLIG